ncbi:VOC family protein [Nocardioides cavernaquae]|uniref:VOC family protein n=1 Tax=Nocardioides cavernaquae TaxID=2321396 RepID=A0A3A5H9T1_9ACTN|nr:VOC family protein [Nocardioides cavernaquae]RJS47386.1 VOC family protein [Nocardioides cavernaquae]
MKISHTFITVDDHDKALAFYRDLLGFTVTKDVSMGDFRWVSVAAPGTPDVEVVLETVGGSPETTPADREALAALLAKGLLRAIILTVDDVDAIFGKLEAAGADVIQEPFDQPYGVRDCAFRDPAGNMVRINQPLA